MRAVEEIRVPLLLWPKQLAVILSRGTEILYGGATESGKSHLVRALSIGYCLAVPGLQCVLIRKKYGDIIANHVRGPTGYAQLLKEMIERRDCKIVETGTNPGVYFSNGSVIAFVHCQDERQFSSAQGVEKHLLIIDEATQISERLIKFFRAWVRMPLEMQARLPKELQGKLPMILYTANPIGPSMGFFRRHFVKARPKMSIAKVAGFLRQYIPARSTDNYSVDQEAHKGRLEGMDDQATARALDVGDWDSPVGDFFPQWDEDRHVILDAEIPSHWTRFSTHDWGGHDPAVYYWWAISDGDMLGGRWIPRGALVCYREWYICADDDPAKGRYLSNEDLADGWTERTEPEYSGQVVFTDSFPFAYRGGETIAQTYAKRGVRLAKGDTSRPQGWSQLGSLLTGRKTNTKGRDPMIYFMEQCKYARDYLPALTRHPTKREDAIESGEATHACDAIRLAAMVQKVVTDAKHPKIKQLLEQLAAFATRPKTLQNLAGINPFSSEPHHGHDD